MAIVTLTTDFGDGSSYVAAMKGALLAVDGHANIIDLSHRLPPQDLLAAAYFLSDTLYCFPAGTIHVVVVDPGVGTERAILCVQWNDQIVLVPDNGCWTPIVRQNDAPPVVFRVEDQRYRRANVSATFHGRDIIAPAAGHLAIGVRPDQLGPRVSGWVRMMLPEASVTNWGAAGQVVIADPFGNLITNIPAELVSAGAAVTVGGQRVSRVVRTYGDAEPETIVALIGSSGRLEIAVVNGSAAVRLGLGVGTPVAVRRNG
jgi:S-adenosylmethionine hydrolase